MMKRSKEESKFNRILKNIMIKTKRSNNLTSRLLKDQQICQESNNKLNNSKQKS